MKKERQNFSISNIPESVHRKKHQKIRLKLEIGRRRYTGLTKPMPLMMSHLSGCAVLGQGLDHQPSLGLVLGQTEAKTCVILKEGTKSRQKAREQEQKKSSSNISKNLRQHDVLDVGGMCTIRLWSVALCSGPLGLSTPSCFISDGRLKKKKEKKRLSPST